jgi:hypothetical protein
VSENTEASAKLSPSTCVDAELAHPLVCERITMHLVAKAMSLSHSHLLSGLLIDAYSSATSICATNTYLAKCCLSTREGRWALLQRRSCGNIEAWRVYPADVSTADAAAPCCLVSVYIQPRVKSIGTNYRSEAEHTLPRPFPVQRKAIPLSRSRSLHLLGCPE